MGKEKNKMEKKYSLFIRWGKPLIAGIFFLGFLFLTVQSTAGSFLTKKIITQRLTRQEAKECGLLLIRFHPHGLKELYAAMGAFYLNRKDNNMALFCIDAIQRSVIPEYGNIEMYKGDILLQLGKIPEACKAYWKEAENFPLAVVPVYKLMRIAAIQGEHAKARMLEDNLESRKKAKSINEKMFQYILANPSYDLQPWRIPKAHGGIESERSHKYQKPGTFDRF
jgi:tetratricopeptide (TPR) repeat protein